MQGKRPIRTEANNSAFARSFATPSYIDDGAFVMVVNVSAVSFVTLSAAHQNDAQGRVIEGCHE